MQILVYMDDLGEDDLGNTVCVRRLGTVAAAQFVSYLADHNVA